MLYFFLFVSSYYNKTILSSPSVQILSLFWNVHFLKSNMNIRAWHEKESASHLLVSNFRAISVNINFRAILHLSSVQRFYHNGHNSIQHTLAISTFLNYSLFVGRKMFSSPFCFAKSFIFPFIHSRSILSLRNYL